MFSENGKLLQVEYAIKASKRGNSVVAADGGAGGSVIFVSEPPGSELVDKQFVDKLSRVDDCTWISFAGLAGDGRVIIKNARKFCSNHHSLFGTAASTHSVASFIGEAAHNATLSDGQ